MFTVFCWNERGGREREVDVGMIPIISIRSTDSVAEEKGG